MRRQPFNLLHALQSRSSQGSPAITPLLLRRERPHPSSHPTVLAALKRVGRLLDWREGSVKIMLNVAIRSVAVAMADADCESMLERMVAHVCAVRKDSEALAHLLTDSSSSPSSTSLPGATMHTVVGTVAMVAA